MVLSVTLYPGLSLPCLYTRRGQAARRYHSPQKKTAAIESLRVVFKHSGVLSKIVGWFRLIAIVMLLAYSGWVFTAVSYALCALFSRFIISVGRDEYEKVTSGLQA